MDREDFCKRLTQLRMNKGVSARDMSLSLGQSANYINSIENGTNFPSMATFFYICEYLNIDPHEFFDMNTSDPARTAELTALAKTLSPRHLELVIELCKALGKH